MECRSCELEEINYKSLDGNEYRLIIPDSCLGEVDIVINGRVQHYLPEDIRGSDNLYKIIKDKRKYKNSLGFFIEDCVIPEYKESKQ